MQNHPANMHRCVPSTVPAKEVNRPHGPGAHTGVGGPVLRRQTAAGLPWAALWAQPESHCPCRAMAGLIKLPAPLGSGPIWAPPHPIPSWEACVSSSQPCPRGAGLGHGAEARSGASLKAQKNKKQIQCPVGGPGRVGPAKAMDVPACVGRSDPRAGRALPSGCQPETEMGPGHPLPGGQQCSHSLGGSKGGGGESCPGSAHPSPKAASGTPGLGRKAGQLGSDRPGSLPGALGGINASRASPCLQVISGHTNKQLTNSLTQDEYFPDPG